MFKRKYSHFLRGLHSAKIQPLPRDETVASQYSRNSTLAKSKYAIKHSQGSIWNSSASFTSGPQDSATLSHFKRKRRLSRWRSSVTKIASLNAAISLLVSLLGYLSLSQFDAIDDRPGSWNIWLKGSICTCSIVQIALLVLYHSYAQRYTDSLNSSLQRRSRLLRVHRSLWVCALECVLHAIVLIPEEQLFTVQLFDRESSITLNECLFLGVLLRNYDLLRCLYWVTELSALRYLFIVRISRLHPSFLWKYCLKRYGTETVLCGYCATAILCGLAEYFLRKGEADSSLQSLWEAISAVAMTQATVGYGKDTPHATLAQIAIVFSCGFGLLLLSLMASVSFRKLQLTDSQSVLCASMLHSSDLHEHRCSAIRLIQLWWRRHLLRRAHILHVPTSVAFSRQLEDFAGLSWVKKEQPSPSSTLTALRLGFDAKVTELKSKMRDSRALLSPLLVALKTQYRIYILTRTLARPQPRHNHRRLRRLSTISEESSEIASTMTPKHHSVGKKDNYKPWNSAEWE